MSCNEGSHQVANYYSAGIKVMIKIEAYIDENSLVQM